MNSTQVQERTSIPGVAGLLAISSGKGGVGKSTLSANLAVALAGQGLSVGLMDADIYGPNIPGILGLSEKPTVSPAGMLRPGAAHGLKVISMGLLIDRGAPVIWRGPMLAKMINQFLFQVEWGSLDLLVLDLPPGTGDVQITLTQSAPLTGAAIVTTPSALAIEDVRRGVGMFRQAGVPLLGIIENMSAFTCPDCQHTSALFGEGGEELARSFGTPLLGQIPLDPRLRACADAGTPMVKAHPEAPASRALVQLAGRLQETLAGVGN
ncbi:MAG: Mrp/NBP35 family ATP-binding protein [Candidatus Handelsmanbacteria bacterium]|nr:Mrp/NBP35 family ATP-binding protein [Candidatus Handelsmanbacteria bacterium]